MTKRRSGVRKLLGLGVWALTALGGAVAAEQDKGARTTARLEEAVPLMFKDAPLEDVLRFIETATQGPDGEGIPIVIAPGGLEAAGLPATPRVTVVTPDGEPLKKSLPALLKPLGLTYRVHPNGLLVVAAPPEKMRVYHQKMAEALRARLEERITLKFQDAPFEDVLKFVRSATKGPKDSGIPIHVDPVGLQEAGTTMRSPVTIDVKGVPLKTALRDLLKTLGLAYTLKDGMLTITSTEAIDEDVKDVKDAPRVRGVGKAK